MKMPSFQLNDKAIMVTGAASGIGAGLARGLAYFGAAVGCVDMETTGLAQTLAAIETAGGRAIAINADVRDEVSLTAAVDTIETELGSLGGALNCAGVHDNVAAESMTREQWQRLLDVNLSGVFFSCQAQGRALIRNGGGSIVNIGSISAHIANRGLKQVHYNAAKAGVAHLSRSLALEWAGQGIRVNVISPGYTATTMAKRPEVWPLVQHLVDDIPLARMAEVEELVGPAVFLLSDASSYCTGVDLLVDGGAVCW